MKKGIQSNLSHRILSALDIKPVTSIAALARDLDAPRPSVSRAINALADAGLVKREGRTLYLSPPGQEELLRLNAKLEDKLKKTGDVYTGILNRAKATLGSA